MKTHFKTQPPDSMIERVYYCLFVLILFSSSLSSQCLMIPLTIEAQMAKSDVVVEGEVISKAGFETVAQDFIYTTYKLRVTKIFKGRVSGDVIQMVEPGGVVGERAVQVEPGVQLNVGATGTFFLSLYEMKDARDKVKFTEPIYRAHGSTQSVFRYDFASNTALGVFMNHPIDNWYATLQKTSGRIYQTIHPLTLPDAPRMSMVVPAISNMSPLDITAGTFSVLTITGSDFGATMGTSVVEFKKASGGGAEWLPALAVPIVSWSNTQIQVRVPYDAGTGQVRVNVGGMIATSSQSLTIDYNQFNVVFDLPPLTAFRRHHWNSNGTGGFTFNFHTGFNTNTPARESFMRALNSWRCATEVNFIVGATTSTNDDIEDDINIVRFDIGAELAEGVGAHCVTYVTYCALGAPLWSTPIQEIDLVFNDVFPPGLTWEYGPAAPSGTEIDFESIALHELGHAHSLGHVISPPEVLHWIIGPGESKRILSSNDIDGGIHVHSQSTGNPTCVASETYAPMTDYRQVRYVNQFATGIQSGETWSQAYTKLQDALTAVTSCVDTIYVAAGSYYPDEGVGYTNNNQDHRFLLNTTTVLMGGYNASTGVRNLASNFTVLSGDIDQDNVTDADNSRNVVRITADAHLDGFWIERGYADAASGDGRDGGGIYNSASPVIRNTIFRFNKAIGSGSNGRGGALYHLSGNPILFNVLVFGSEATQSGNAFHLQNNVLSCRNCTIANNDGPASSAVHIDGVFHTFLNSVFWLNGGDMTIAAGQSADCSSSMFQDVAFAPGAFGTGVMFGVDPMFESNLSLSPCSPGVNTGTNGFNTTTTDVLGNPRFVGTIDRGAFEHATPGMAPSLVTTVADSGPGSLRTILTNLCTGQTVTFSPSLNGQTIVLNGGPGLTLTKNVIIDGPGINLLSISGDEVKRIFNVNAGITATIKELALIDGNAQTNTGNCIRNFGNLTLQDIRLTSYSGAEFTLTLFNDDGTLTFKNQVIVE